MKTIPLTKGKYAIVDDDDYDELSKYKWCLHSAGYACRNTYEKGGRKPTLRYMHREIVDAPPSKSVVVDHVNRDRLDNRRENIRVVTRLANLMNSARYDGVSV